MGSPYELDFAFDSNAIRALEKLDPRVWKRLSRRWIRLGVTTGWAPNAISEVMGTNLVRASGRPSDADVRSIALGVRRFDRLAGGRILLQADDLVRKSFFE